MKEIFLKNIEKNISIIKNWYKNDKNIIIASIILGVSISFLSILYTKNYSYKIQKDISNQLIRLHVLANSDKEKDQNLKIKVRDNILCKYGDIIEKYNSIEDTKKFLKDNLEDIKNTTKQVILEEGFNYDVKVIIENSIFPTKEYANLKLPSGEYEALKVIIGEGKGKNWWCVLFPPLCFVDVSKGVISEDMKDKLKNVLSPEEYKLILNSDKDIIDVKFKIVEFWQNKKLKIIKR